MQDRQMRFFDNWWDYVPGLVRCTLATLMTVVLTHMVPLGHFWD